MLVAPSRTKRVGANFTTLTVCSGLLMAGARPNSSEGELVDGEEKGNRLGRPMRVVQRFWSWERCLLVWVGRCFLYKLMVLSVARQLS